MQKFKVACEPYCKLFASKAVRKIACLHKPVTKHKINRVDFFTCTSSRAYVTHMAN